MQGEDQASCWPPSHLTSASLTTIFLPFLWWWRLSRLSRRGIGCGWSWRRGGNCSGVPLKYFFHAHEPLIAAARRGIALFLDILALARRGTAALFVGVLMPKTTTSNS